MKKQYIEFKIEHQRITRTDDFFVVGKSKNYLHARFEFCEDWSGEQITAVFDAAGKPYTRLIENGECCVPWEVLLCKNFFVSCFAGTMITSNAAEVKVNTGGACGGDPGVDPTPTAYEQIVAIMEETKQIAEDMQKGGGTVDPEYVGELVEEYLTENPPPSGEKGDKGEPGEPGKDGYTPVKGKDYYTPADKAEMVDAVLAALPTYNGEVDAV